MYTCVVNFLRVEFQQRGSPHVHMVMWLENKQGERPEEVLDKKEMAQWLDGVISANVPEENDEYRQKFLKYVEEGLEKELIEKASTFQNHRHTFR